jgi:hypothetical protein
MDRWMDRTTYREIDRERESARERERISEPPPPFDSLVRQAIHASQQPNSPIGFVPLKLPPRPCAVLLEGRNDHGNVVDDIAVSLCLVLGRYPSTPLPVVFRRNAQSSARSAC